MGDESKRVACSVCLLLCREVLCGEMKVQAPGELMKEWQAHAAAAPKRLTGEPGWCSAGSASISTYSYSVAK